MKPQQSKRHPQESDLANSATLKDSNPESSPAELNLAKLDGTHLHDNRLTSVQRQQAAIHIGQTLGNRHLQRLLEKRPVVQAGGESALPIAQTMAPTAVQRDIWDTLSGIGSAIGDFFGGIIDAIAKFLKPKYIDKVRAVAVLEKTYGKYKTIGGGKVEVLPQAEFQAQYDKIYGSGKFAWDKYVVPKFGNLEGFAHQGTNYINKDKMAVDTTPHEMLHSNTDPAFTKMTSGNINEGATEYLTIKSVTEAGFTPTHSYPNQEAVIQKLVAIVGEETLCKAYFNGEVAALKSAMESNCKGTWDEFKAAMDAEDWTLAKAKLEKKAEATTEGTE